MLLLLPHNADVGREEARTGSKDIALCFFPPPIKSHPSVMFTQITQMEVKTDTITPSCETHQRCTYTQRLSHFESFSFFKSAVLPLSGSIDSNWIVGATLEKKLLPLPLSLALSGFLNHRKNKFQCGFGVNIG